jgi:hypothetical protein
MRLLVVFLASIALAWGQADAPLRLEKTIALPDVQGRIDHMSVDVKSGRLFISALGNNTIEVLDINAAKRLTTIKGLREPQGVLYVGDTNRLYVANGEDGSVRIFDANSYKLLSTLNYGEDADNLRYDPVHKSVYVGFGAGALGEIDKNGNKVAEIRLDAHPESFQLEKAGPRIYVNVPNARRIAVVDRERHAVIATWKTDLAFANFPMALDEPDHRLFVVTRLPPRLLVMDTASGNIIQKLPAVSDSDDVFYDAARKRIYASGGGGEISVFQQKDPDHFSELPHLNTVKGARTSFFSPDLDRLFLAVRREGEQSAEIRIYAPTQ